LRWGRTHGFEVFDFGGAGRPDEPYGPREFKAKFGGELVDYGRDVLVHAPARLRVSRTAFAAAQRLRTRRTASERAR
jgi:lipid II:glycine glycyltransferase (peptidoglycan interpeptide bridge formation enzyme)